VDLLRVDVERGERAHGGDQDPHRVGVVVETIDELLDVLVDERVVGDELHPLVELVPGGELPVGQEVGDLQEAGLLRQLFDGIAAVPEDAGVPVDERHRAPAARGVEEGRVVGQDAGVLAGERDLLQVLGPNGAVHDRDLVDMPGPVVGDGQALLAFARGHPARLLVRALKFES